MTPSNNRRTDEDRSRQGTGAGGPQITPEVILAELAEIAKKGGKA